MKIPASFFILFSFLLFVSSACVKEEIPKKVSLAKKPVQKLEEIEYTPQDTLWFGFDLRPGAKDDERAYIPLLKYLENTTGRRFHIKLSRTPKDTVEDLGTGVTHFAAVSTLSYISGEAKYGIGYLVKGVNKRGISEPYTCLIIAYSSSVDNRTVEAVRAALLALEPMGKHKDMLVDWDKTEMPTGFTAVDEPEL